MSLNWKRIFRFNLRTLLFFSLVIALLCSAYVCIPFATFEQISLSNHKVLKVKTLYPVSSVMFDAIYSLESTERIPEWQRGWFETKSGKFTSWNGLVLNHQQNGDLPKWIMFDTPYFGHQYYEIEHVDGKMKFHPRVVPEYLVENLRYFE